jgi:predicted ferric reductase
MGWITACNLTLSVFLALKNTPLAFLTAYSYERLRILHQLAGYTTIFCMCLHSTTYLITISQFNLLTPIMTQLSQIMGAVVGVSLLSIIPSFFLLRKRSYELFYATHMILFLLIIIGLGFHRPQISGKVIYIFFFSAGIFFLDRVFRFLKLALYFPGNHATVTALEHGGVRIVLKRTPWRTVPGSHVFLWIPKISLAQTHPFTVVSTNPLELVVKAHDGFTKHLLAYASTKGDSGDVWASADGPYGTLPAFSNYDHVVLIAGGSGATFTFGIATQLLRKAEKEGARKPIVHFIWVIRETGTFVPFFLVIVLETDDREQKCRTGSKMNSPLYPPPLSSSSPSMSRALRPPHALSPSSTLPPNIAHPTKTRNPSQQPQIPRSPPPPSIAILKRAVAKNKEHLYRAAPSVEPPTYLL